MTEWMKRSVLWIGVVAGTAAMTGCGTSRLTAPPSGFRSAMHNYSVGQVETAFAAHGIQLHKVAKQPFHVTNLMSGTGADRVFVAVETGVTTGAYLIPIPVKHKTHHGNVTAVWLSRGSAVSASLNGLH